MKMSKKYKCFCESCFNAQKTKIKESDLHLFVGFNDSNSNEDLDSFESNINYTSVTHWDVGFSERARYYVYHDEAHNLIGWYDTCNSVGYKQTK